MNVINTYFPNTTEYNYNNLIYFIETELPLDLRIKFVEKIIPYLDEISNNYLSSDIFKLKLNDKIELTRFEISIIIAASFLCKIKNVDGPYGCKNFHNIFHKPPKISFTSSFKTFEEYQLNMVSQLVDDPDDINNLCIEKLKFMYNYFDCVYNNRNDINSIPVKFIKVSNPNYELPINRMKLSPIEIRVCDIDDVNNEYFKINFANKYIGGKVLSSGCCQEEIKFLCSPELIACLIISDPLLDSDIITVSKVMRYSLSSGYGYELKYAGSISDKVIYDDILEIDATRYTPKNKYQQYFKEHIEREIIKASIGFASCNSNTIVTGAWGCGAFHGDQLLKFIIQVYAASVNQKKIIYCVRDKYIYCLNYIIY